MLLENKWEKSRRSKRKNEEKTRRLSVFSLFFAVRRVWRRPRSHFQTLGLAPKSRKQMINTTSLRPSLAECAASPRFTIALVAVRVGESVAARLESLVGGLLIFFGGIHVTFGRSR